MTRRRRAQRHEHHTKNTTRPCGGDEIMVTKGTVYF
jgi:hypothetical protein